MLLAHTPTTDRFGFCQAYSDDDKSDDYLLEEGRQLANLHHECGGSNWVPGVLTGYPTTPSGGQHSTFRAQELRGLTTGRLVPHAGGFVSN